MLDNIGFILYNKIDSKRKDGNEMSKFQVIFFQKENGESPSEQFIDSLDVKMQAKIYMLLQLLSENGNNMREPYSKHLDDGIFELRAKVGSDISRVLYFFYVRHRIIVTNGFVKKTQKTPKSEIEKAKEYRKEYLERKEDNQ